MPNAVGEVREGLPGSTLERGMREEKRQEPGRPRRLLLRLMMRLVIARHTASEPTHGESQKLVGRSLNDFTCLIRSSDRGRLAQPNEERPTAFGESDQLIVL